MVDRTQEDINQDARLLRIENDVRNLHRAIDSLHISFDDFTITVHKHDRLIKILDPLQMLVDHVEQIKQFFESWKKGFSK